tara:strand:+ start:2703 stop:2975 length:273 start_codon:yes stop_codon:yes gene_type:complete
MGCATSISLKGKAAARWRRHHDEDDWLKQIVHDWAPSYREQLVKEEAALAERRRTFEGDPERHYCDTYATARGNGRYTLSYSQYMKCSDI